MSVTDRIFFFFHKTHLKSSFKYSLNWCFHNLLFICFKAPQTCAIHLSTPLNPCAFIKREVNICRKIKKNSPDMTKLLQISLYVTKLLLLDDILIIIFNEHLPLFFPVWKYRKSLINVKRSSTPWQISDLIRHQICEIFLLSISLKRAGSPW